MDILSCLLLHKNISLFCFIRAEEEQKIVFKTLQVDSGLCPHRQDATQLADFTLNVACWLLEGFMYSDSVRFGGAPK